ncbi:MAG: carbamoyltransferase HypF, partial [Candidatus Marinimicrobia bacterium]|nr:carbamoyltransferase HypF [Candidatus Neomarinimicrobiota bacterium]
MKIVRKKINVQGIVQGVGFRPFIFNLAVSHKLIGFVSNTPQGVIIEVEGTFDKINQFVDDIKPKAPPIAVITDINSQQITPTGVTGFNIIKSDRNEKISTLISPDVAVCDDCLIELFDPNDRRYHYPFINCTNCGPRYTIIDNIPYDRPYTSMKHFNMCVDCQAEYDDPTNRRFHAQPNACPKCGPQVKLFDSEQNLQDVENTIEATREKLKKGKIVAIKGLGGFHLAVDATNNKMVQKLRKLKGRDEKPFALMVRDIKIAHQYCTILNEEAQVLQSYAAPIMLLKKLLNSHIAESVAPGNDYLGMMLPYTPLHHVLLQDLDIPLVMTSANYSEEPICIDNNETFERLKSIADYFLIHNRDIYLRSDDSVAIHLANKTR